MNQRAEIERRAIENAAESDRKSGPYYAEIVPNTTPIWCIVKTAPGQADKAARFLEARGFGLFLPKFVPGARLVKRHEVTNLSNKLIFSNFVFVHVWDVLKHWRRIMACPGVQSIWHDSNAKPRVLSWEEIDKLVARQYTQGISRPKRRKRYASADDSIKIYNRSHWHVDDKQQNSVPPLRLGAAW